MAKDNKKRDADDLEDLMLQEALRLSLLNPENNTANPIAETTDTPESDSETDDSSSPNRDELELALALALSLQNVIK